MTRFQQRNGNYKDESNGNENSDNKLKSKYMNITATRHN